ncbi:hypothetical protein KRX11_10110 [Pasteurellaceae bacterium TAE3-ERU1]|uniref:hypothetical protein n=1 Tax=Spirabiliibacterium mucosae TaxID=28156 RepID=UPI001AAD426F|nr:hypothetical protein [Spirabiliibacterium mucosae]MBE2898114.1 hypothetical protein [Spirabiliibacterium mucosae]MBV7388987.1 hypothetical protein [Pasteurellaceae bacterium TAE3-ERU1]
MLRQLFSPLWVIEWIALFCLAAALAVSCAPQPQEAKDTDYYNHTVSYVPTTDDLAQASEIWNEEEGELQSDLTPEVEVYLRQKVAEMQR